jgi:hypothetical protein
MQDLLYIGSVFAFLIGSAALAGVAWLAVEGVYWIYCKAIGREY